MGEPGYVCLFEAKKIQHYIFASGRLRDLIGASELIDALVRTDGNDLLDAVIKRVPALAGARFSRRASGAFCVHHSDRATLVRFRAQWRLALMTMLPGLEIADTIFPGQNAPPMADEEAMTAAYKSLPGITANQAASVLPLGRPTSEYVSRTGLPAVAVKHYGEDEAVLDAIGLPVREQGDRLQGKLDGVAGRFLGRQPANVAYAFPRNLDETEGDDPNNPLFPFRRRKRGAEGATPIEVWKEDVDYRLAVVHADVSGLGELLIARQADIAEKRLALSAQIDSAIKSAVWAANAVLLGAAPAHARDPGLHVVPARPIVMGGDDITALVRADLAPAWASRLLAEIESETVKIGVPLSACAGVAIINRKSPFLAAYNLAESLCAFAKQQVKCSPARPFPSAIAFHVQNQTALEDYAGDILPAMRGVDGTFLTANPYGVGEAARQAGLPGFDRLVAIARAIAAIRGAAGALREIKTFATNDPARADARWRRWRTVAKRNQADELAAFDVAAGVVGDSDKSAPPIVENREGDSLTRMTLLFDALALIDLGAAEAIPNRPTLDQAA